MRVPQAALRGHDPYDALLGTRVPSILRRSARGRQLAIQLRKRCPIDLSGLLGIEPFVMAKSVACALAAAVRGGEHDTADLVRFLVEAQLPAGGWGYEFDVQTRWAYYPAGTPNAIATAFAVRALAGVVVRGPSDAQVREALSAAAALFDGTLAGAGPDGPFTRYTPGSDTLVHNANLLGAASVATLGTLLGDGEPLLRATECAATTIAAQRPDGSWPYGAGGSLGWSDNFHTAYDLDGLLQVWLVTNDETVKRALDRGVEHWAGAFFGQAGEPRYFAGRAYPYDIHSAATAIDVAARLATWGWPTGDLARRVAGWTDAHLVNAATGETYYQRHRLFTDRRHFVRWGDAHLALGRASLALLDAGSRDPVEEAIHHG